MFFITLYPEHGKLPSHTVPSGENWKTHAVHSRSLTFYFFPFTELNDGAVTSSSGPTTMGLTKFLQLKNLKGKERTGKH